jgi:RsiW-degrading membrane proteinase PrsW (M82 family)
LTLCALLTAGLVYRYDLYEHEPISLLAIAIALGAGGMWLAGRLEGWTLAHGPSLHSLEVAGVASLVEELLKLVVVLVVVVHARREFDDPMDGVVYGSMAGLGAAVEESVYYVGLSPAKEAWLPAGELVRLWAHVVLGGIIGFPAGFWRARPRRAALATGVALGVAVGLHLGWDAIVLSVPEGVSPSVVQTLLGVAIMVASLALYGRLVTLASASSRQEFAPGSPRRLWGWPFNRLAGLGGTAPSSSHTPPGPDTDRGPGPPAPFPPRRWP